MVALDRGVVLQRADHVVDSSGPPARRAASAVLTRSAPWVTDHQWPAAARPEVAGGLPADLGVVHVEVEVGGVEDALEVGQIGERPVEAARRRGGGRR